MAQAAGYRVIRHGWMDPYTPRPGRRQVVERTDEEAAAIQASNERMLDMVMESGNSGRGLEKVKDREARVFAEGDTDLNHDNVEAAE